MGFRGTKKRHEVEYSFLVTYKRTEGNGWCLAGWHAGQQGGKKQRYTDAGVRESRSYSDTHIHMLNPLHQCFIGHSLSPHTSQRKSPLFKE